MPARPTTWPRRSSAGSASARATRSNQPAAVRSRSSARGKAIADSSAAIRLDPKDANAYNGRGLSWRSKGAYQQALADLNEASRLDPALAWAYNNRGCVWRDVREYARALADFEHATRLDAS